MPLHVARPHAANQHRILQRPGVGALAGSPDDRTGRDRSASDRRRTTPDRVPPPFQYFTTSSHSCFGGAGRRRANAGIPAAAHCIGRRMSRFWRRCMASTGGGCVPAAAAALVRMSANIRNTGAGVDAYAPSENPATITFNATTPPAIVDADAPGRCRHGTRRQVRHRHNQRQRVACRERLLKQQIEDEVRPERHRKDHERVTRSPQQQRRADGRGRQDGGRQLPRGPRRDEARSTAPTRAGARVGVVHSIWMPVRSSAPWSNTARQYARRAAGEDDERHRPHERNRR